ncbi:MAG: dTMP kinase [Pyrinomonadaceae bacterium]|nr:dTMP kinase [Pyrinomonadaceae bacterium]
MEGKLITLEGIDGSGKSTQMKMLADELAQKGFDVLTTFEPGDTDLGRILRRAFLETEDTISPTAELLLFAADRAQHVDHLIKPALEAGKIVISDRYADATFAYQGAGRGFPVETVNEVIRIATGGLKPDLTIFFDLTVDAALGRADARSKNNRMDSEEEAFYHRVRDAYLGIAEREPDRFKVINGEGPRQEISKEVVELVEGFLSGTAASC